MKYKKADIVFKNEHAEVALVENNTFYVHPAAIIVVIEGRKIVKIADKNGLDAKTNFLKKLTALKVPLKVFKNGFKAPEPIIESIEPTKIDFDASIETVIIETQIPKTNKRKARKRRKDTDEL